MDANLFKPNSHSNFEIRWKLVSGERQEAVRNLLAKHYGIEAVENIEQIDAFEVRSNNFRITYGSGKQALLRKHIQHASAQAVTAIDLLIEKVAEGGVPVPRVIAAKDGTRFIEEGGSLWQLYQFIPGNYYRGTLEELEQASRGVASLHRALAALPATDSTKSPSWVLPTTADFEFIFKEAQGDGEPLGVLVRAQKESIVRRIEDLSLHAEAIKNAGMQMIHADLHPHNFLFDGEVLTAILDFGDVRPGFRAADAASACHRLVRQYVVHEGRPWQETLKEGLDIFVTLYQKGFPLPKEELELFPEFMELALLRKVKGNLLKYYEKKPEWPHEVAHKEFIKQVNLLAEVDVMKEPLKKIIAEIA